MTTIKDLSVKQLVKVLTDLRGGTIGFDPYRDPRTNNKANLLAFILKEYTNEQIIAAIARETGGANNQASDAMQVGVRVFVAYEPAGQPPHLAVFDAPNTDMAQGMAQAWIGKNPMYRFFGRWPGGPDAAYAHCPVGHTETYASPAAAAKSTSQNAISAALVQSASPTPQAPTSNAAKASDKLAALQALLSLEVDESKIQAICDARAASYVENILGAVNTRLDSYDSKIQALEIPVTVQVLPAGGSKPTPMGIQHKHFPDLLKFAQARTRDGNRLNIWLAGPAGSGKTTAAKKVAEALALQFQFNGAISTEYELMGFRDAAGHYHRTAFREVFENGGVYLFDEVDSSMPKAVLAFNAALANGQCRFPDGMIQRHKDCVVIAGANTFGKGATSEYVGRMKQDEAFLDRFVPLEWPLDLAFERALAADKKWVKHVQQTRKNADKRALKNHIISPRATFYGEALLAAGVAWELVERACLKKALTDETWEHIQVKADEKASENIPF